jgi:flagellin-like protein
MLNMINKVVSSKRGELSKMLRSKKGISPILATLLLIAIAVGAILITYAWVITFTSTQTQQSGAIIALENIRFYAVGSTNNMTEIILRNSGTSSAKIASVYWSSSSFSALAKIGTSEYTLTPTTGLVDALSSINITITWGGAVVTPSAWTSGSTYYFKVVTETGQYLQFTGKAP